MDMKTLRTYKDMFIDNYDTSNITNGVVTFYGVQLKDNIPQVSFHFADMVVFEYDENTLNISIYQKKKKKIEPIEIKNLI